MSTAAIQHLALTVTGYPSNRNRVQDMFGDLVMHQVHTQQVLHNCVTASANITSRPRLRSTSSRRYERQRVTFVFVFRTKSLE